MNEIIQNWKKFLFLESNKNEIDVEEKRILIANEIDMSLMRPTVNIGDPNDMMVDYDEEGNRFERPFGKEDSTFLLYLYRGFDEKGNLSNEENIEDVNSELNNRAENFLYALDKQAIAVFLSDFDDIVDFMSNNKRTEEESSYQTMYMAKKAPGKFTNEMFAKRNRALYKDTYTYGGGIDFMFKKSPELKNIKPEHQFLFKLENLLGRVKGLIINKQTEVIKSDQDLLNVIELSKTIPQMTYKDWNANYREGVTTEKIQQELDEIKPVYQQDSITNYFTFKDNEILRLLYNTHKQGESSPIYKDDKLYQQFFDTVQAHISSLLTAEERQIQNRSYPSLLIRMSMMYDKKMIPKEFLSEENYNLFIKLKEMVSDYNELDEYSFIFPLDPDKVPKEIKDQTHEKDAQNRRKIKNIKNKLNDISNKINSKKTLTLKEVEELFDLCEDVSENFKKDLKKAFDDVGLTTNSIVNYLSTNLTTNNVENSTQEFEKKLDNLESIVYSNKEMSSDLFADFIKSMETLKTNNKLKPYEERINKLFDYLEGK